MPYMINIFNIKTNNVASSGSVTFGPVGNNANNVYLKAVGLNTSSGDFSSSSSLMINGMLDPDVSDQAQMANPASVVQNQV